MANRRISSKLKAAVAERACHCCEYCRTQWQHVTGSFSGEHILPVSKGGLTTLENLALSCQHCNNYKHDKIEGRDPATRETAALYNPRTQRWRDHFEWNSDYTLIIGLTPTGRCTVETLRLNRECLRNWRRALHSVGVHPPDDD